MVLSYGSLSSLACLYMSQLLGSTYNKRDFFHVIHKENVLCSQLLGVFDTSINQNVPLVNWLPINLLIKFFPLTIRGGPIQQILIGCPLSTSALWGQPHHCSCVTESELVRMVVHSVNDELCQDQKFCSRRFCKLPIVYFPKSKSLPLECEQMGFQVLSWLFKGMWAFFHLLPISSHLGIYVLCLFLFSVYQGSS